MAHKPRREVDVFWDFGSCPAPADTSGYTIANQIRTLALRLGVIKSFKAYLSISDHCNGRALTLRSELQCSGVSLTDAPGTKDIADKMLIVDLLSRAFDSNSQDDSKIIMLIAGDPSFSYLLSILRMRNHRVVVLGPGGAQGPEGYTNNSAPLASQANLWLDWNTEVMDGIIPRSTEVNRVSQTTENLNSSSESLKSESPSGSSRETLVSAIAEAASARAQIDEFHEVENSRESTIDQQPTPQPTFSLREPIRLKDRSGTTLSWSELASKYRKATTEDQVVNSRPITTSDKGGAQILTKPQTQAAAAILYNTSDDTSRAQGTQRPDGGDSGWAPALTSLPTSTLDDWPRSQTTPTSSSFWNSKPSGNPPEYSPSASGWTSTSNKTAPTLATSTPSVVPEQFNSLVGCLRLSIANGVRKPLWGVIAFELIKLDPNTYTKAGAQRFSQYVAMAAEKGIVTIVYVP
ncbi:hypothetical protein MD484_g2814, partial [Candolleomyces efflorescens]